MTDDKKVVLKVNYSGNQHHDDLKTETVPRMVTEWKIKRIITAVVLLLAMIGIAFYFLLRESGSEMSVKDFDANPKTFLVEPTKETGLGKPELPVKQAIPSKKDNTEITTDKEKTGIPVSEPVKNIQPVKLENGNNLDKNAVDPVSSEPVEEKGKSEIIIPEKTDESEIESPVVELPVGLNRALITSSIWRKEPIDRLVSPVVTKKNKSISVFYFTELIDKKGETVFHVWKKDGKIKFRKKIKIRGNRWRASTSKLMNSKTLGEWTVQLISVDGKLINEINFTVTE